MHKITTITYHLNDPGSLSKHLGTCGEVSFYKWYSYLEGCSAGILALLGEGLFIHLYGTLLYVTNLVLSNILGI